MVVIIGYQVYDVARADYGMSIREASLMLGLLGAFQFVPLAVLTPVIVGFGINTPDSAKAIAGVADGAVVGSAIVKLIGEGRPVAEVLDFVKGLAAGAHSA